MIQWLLALCLLALKTSVESLFIACHYAPASLRLFASIFWTKSFSLPVFSLGQGLGTGQDPCPYIGGSYSFLLSLMGESKHDSHLLGGGLASFLPGIYIFPSSSLLQVQGLAPKPCRTMDCLSAYAYVPKVPCHKFP